MFAEIASTSVSHFVSLFFHLVAPHPQHVLNISENKCFYFIGFFCSKIKIISPDTVFSEAEILCLTQGGLVGKGLNSVCACVFALCMCVTSTCSCVSSLLASILLTRGLKKTKMKMDRFVSVFPFLLNSFFFFLFF